MLNNPYISVIITSFNSEKYIQEAIESVLKQTYQKFEIIIVDDGSRDKTKSILKFYQKKDKRIKIFFFKKNSGTASVPRNFAVTKCKYDYIALLDSDDLWEINKLETQIMMMNKNDELSFSSVKYIDKRGNKHSNFFIDFIRQKLQKFFFKKGVTGLYAYNSVMLSTVIIKKKILQKYKFNENKNIVGNEDLELWLRIFSLRFKKIVFIEKFLARIRRSPKSLNILYSRAQVRNIFCISKFFLDKNSFQNYSFFLIGIFLRAFKSLTKYTFSSYTKKISYIIFYFVIFYFLIFVSPLPSYLGNKLIHYSKTTDKNSEILLIISGNGDSDYINTGYQRRYLDAKYYLKDNNYKKIILIGRKQQIEEYQIMKSLLLMDGIQESKIQILKMGTTNTFQTLNKVKEFLDENKYKSVTLITSEYHTQRCYLVWKKIDKLNEFNFNIVKNIKNINSIKTKWNASYTDIKVILYEYLAIIYYKLSGKA